MTAFTKDEQWDHNYDLFVTDKEGKIGCLSHVGWRLLPPTIEKSKEDWQKVHDFFYNLPIKNKGYEICPNFETYSDKDSIVSFENYFKLYGGMSSRGLYSYDSYDFSFNERPYFRVTIPKDDLILDELPNEIKNILNELRLNEISFAKDSLIPEKIISKL